MNIEEIFENLKKYIPESNIYMNEPMSKHTSFKIGGNADIFVKIREINEIEYILKYTKEKKIPLTIIGNGSNILVKDNGIRGITMQIDIQNIEIEKKNNKFLVKVGAGVKLGFLAIKLQKQSISGFEFASGIPGTIGGAIRMNAGAYGKEFKEIVKSATYIDKDGNIKELKNEDINFSYRCSRFIECDDIIIDAILELEEGNEEEIKQKMNEYKNARIEKQPTDFPSAGSTFKRGTDFISAKLIDEAGLKGKTIGGAQVSKKHAGFIINKGNATAKDVLELVDFIIKTIYEKYDKILELEIEVIGE